MSGALRIKAYNDVKHEYCLTHKCGEDCPFVKWYGFCPFKEL